MSLEQRLCQRVARAIYELDNAGWSVDNNAADRNTIEDCRVKLASILNAHGYEFAANDSPRIRKSRTVIVKPNILSMLGL